MGCSACTACAATRRPVAAARSCRVDQHGLKLWAAVRCSASRAPPRWHQWAAGEPSRDRTRRDHQLIWGCMRTLHPESASCSTGPRRRRSQPGGMLQARHSPCVRALASEPLFLGLDWGTSGARAALISGRRPCGRPGACRPLGGPRQAQRCAEGGQLRAEARQPYIYTEDGSAWRAALYSMLAQLPLEAKQAVASVAVDATSSTALLVDRHTGQMLAPPKVGCAGQPRLGGKPAGRCGLPAD